MNESPTRPRVKGLDVPFFVDRRADRLRARSVREERIRQAANQVSQVEYYGLMSECEHIGFYEFALGYSMENVRLAFAQAVTAALRVFELRGTIECRVDRPGIKDYSLTNSHTCFRAICMALAAREDAAARTLAHQMEDPPKADYVGTRSEVCTSDQQSIAYAVKHFMLDNRDDVAKELRRTAGRKTDPQVAAMGKMVQGLAGPSDAVFNEGLLELLFFHRKQARRSENKTDPSMFFSLPAIGLSILGVQRGTLDKTALPMDDYLPLELIPDRSASR